MSPRCAPRCAPWLVAGLMAFAVVICTLVVFGAILSSVHWTLDLIGQFPPFASSPSAAWDSSFSSLSSATG